MRAQLVGALVLCVFASGCVPVTLSHEGAVDFDRYAAVFVQVSLVGELGARYGDYLVDELRDGSGFTNVSRTTSASVDAVLDVTVRVDESFDGEESDFEATASYVLQKPDGGVVDSGSVSSSSGSFAEAVEDALDLVANHYLAPYAI